MPVFLVAAPTCLSRLLAPDDCYVMSSPVASGREPQPPLEPGLKPLYLRTCLRLRTGLCIPRQERVLGSRRQTGLNSVNLRPTDR
jgi:hypothetical protein